MTSVDRKMLEQLLQLKIIELKGIEAQLVEEAGKQSISIATAKIDIAINLLREAHSKLVNG